MLGSGYVYVLVTFVLFKSKSSLYLPHYVEACDELRAPSLRLNAWATALTKRRNGGESMATLCQFDWPRNQTPDLLH